MNAKPSKRSFLIEDLLREEPQATSWTWTPVTWSACCQSPDLTGPREARKTRRNRTVFTELQLMGLERRFDSQKYLSTPDRAELARALGLTQLQVKTWYQNRRMKWKKQVMSGGCPVPTKPKGRPKKDSIPSLGLMPFDVLAQHSLFQQNSLNLR